MSNTEDSTESLNFDLNEIMSEQMDGALPNDGPSEDSAAADDESREVEPGPESFEEDESGELESDEAEDGEGLEEEAETPEAKDEDPPVAREAKPDPKDDRIRSLETRLEESLRQQHQILDFLLQQRQAQAQQPAPKPSSDLPLEVMQDVLFNGGQGLEKLDPATQARARQAAMDYAKRESEYALHPEKRYDDFRERVMQDVFQAMQPLLQNHYNGMVEQQVQKLESQFGDPADKQRLQEVFFTIEGHDSEDPRTLRNAFELARKTVELEKAQRALTDQQQRLQATERTRKAARKGVQPTRGRGATPSNPVFTRPNVPGTDLESIMQHFQQQELGA